MRNLLLASLVMFSTFAANASSAEANGPLDSHLYSSEVNENKSYYETLGDMFKTGTKPNVEKLVNVLWAGRCFFDSEQNTPVPGAALFREKKTLDVGPIGIGNKKYEGLYIHAENTVANYFDNQTFEEVIKNNLGREIKFTDVESTPTSIKVSLPGLRSIDLRVVGKYLVVEGKRASDVYPIVTIPVRCYYFIPEIK